MYKYRGNRRIVGSKASTVAKATHTTGFQTEGREVGTEHVGSQTSGER